ncbi:MAG: hypothetical protein K2X94_01580 [Amoebophilaceae bacterium]|nr:hypothetical protein [Amoebophilaceae bacterium]
MLKEISRKVYQPKLILNSTTFKTMKIAPLKKHFNSLSLKKITTFGLLIILQAQEQFASGYTRPTKDYETSINGLNTYTYNRLINTGNLSLGRGKAFLYTTIEFGDRDRLKKLLDRINIDRKENYAI